MQFFDLYDAWISEFSLLEFREPMQVDARFLGDTPQRLSPCCQQIARFGQQCRCFHRVILSILVLICQVPKYSVQALY